MEHIQNSFFSSHNTTERRLLYKVPQPNMPKPDLSADLGLEGLPDAPENAKELEPPVEEMAEEQLAAVEDGIATADPSQVLDTLHKTESIDQSELVDLRLRLDVQGLNGFSLIDAIEAQYPAEKLATDTSLLKKYQLHVRELEKAAHATSNWGVLPGYGIAYAQGEPFMYKVDVTTQKLLAYTPHSYQEFDLVAGEWKDATPSPDDGLYEIYSQLSGKDGAEFFINMELEQSLQGDEKNIADLAKDVRYWTKQNTIIFEQHGFTKPEKATEAVDDAYEKLEDALGNYADDFVMALENGNENAADAAQASFNEQLMTIQNVPEQKVEDWLATKGITNNVQIGEYIVIVADGKISYTQREGQTETPMEKPEPRLTKAPDSPEQLDPNLERLLKILQNLIDLLQDPANKLEAPEPPKAPEEPSELLQLREEEKSLAEELAGLESEREEAITQHADLLQNTVPLTANALDNLNRIDDKIIAADAAIAELKNKLEEVRAAIAQLEAGVDEADESMSGPIPIEKLQAMTIEELRAELEVQQGLQKKMMERIQSSSTATSRSQAVLQKINDTIDQLQRALRIRETASSDNKLALLQELFTDNAIQVELLGNDEVLFTFTPALTEDQQAALQSFAAYVPGILSNMQLSQNGSTITIAPTEAYWSTDNIGIAMRETTVAILQYVMSHVGTVPEIVNGLQRLNVS